MWAIFDAHVAATQMKTRSGECLYSTTEYLTQQVSVLAPFIKTQSSVFK